jgi:pilus assembly protein CpaB
MDLRRVIILCVAGVAALGVLFLIRGLVNRKSDKAPQAQVAQHQAPAMIYVAVADHDLNIGDRVSESDLTWQPWPAVNVNENYVTNGPVPDVSRSNTVVKGVGAALATADVVKKQALGMQGTPGEAFLGAVIKDTVRKGEPMLPAKVGKAGQSGVMAVRLEPGMRAMAIPLSAESSAGGFVLPGDHVDVVQIRKIGADVTSRTVMRNVRVLAIDQNTNGGGKGSSIGATATMEVTPQQAENLVLAKAQGDLTLVLRSYADIGGPAVDNMIKTAQDILANPVVKVYRGAASTEVRVAR